MRTVFASLLGLSLLAACSPVPIAGTYPVTVEQRMQSVSHWQVLAEQTVEAAAPGLPHDRPVYLGMTERASECTFCIAFNNYLTTALRHRGYSLTLDEGPNTSAIHYSVQAVPFLEWKDREAIPGFFTLLAGGAWLGTQGATHWGLGASSAAAAAIPAGVALDLANGAFATPTDSELIVNIDVTAGSQEIFRDSHNFYVAGVDLWQYTAPRQDTTLVQR
ncbi:MAG TPA: hypothetical protein VG328_05480 [Stellaceae bacterium]|jgi:hypothetical protein|nr:hypothetical protein [Stellaceae bacterium]